MTKQSLIDFSATRQGLKCVHNGVTRVVTHVVGTSDGIIWGEPNWAEDYTSHGVHLVEGEVTGKGPWRIAGRLFEENK